MNLIKVSKDLYINQDEICSIISRTILTPDKKITIDGSKISMSNGFDVYTELTPEELVKFIESYDQNQTK